MDDDGDVVQVDAAQPSSGIIAGVRLLKSNLLYKGWCLCTARGVMEVSTPPPKKTRFVHLEAASKSDQRSMGKCSGCHRMEISHLFCVSVRPRFLPGRC